LCFALANPVHPFTSSIVAWAMRHARAESPKTHAALPSPHPLSTNHTTGYALRITYYVLRITPHSSLITPHSSPTKKPPIPQRPRDGRFSPAVPPSLGWRSCSVIVPNATSRTPSRNKKSAGDGGITSGEGQPHSLQVQDSP
jgi:hypothetical protein